MRILRTILALVLTAGALACEPPAVGIDEPGIKVTRETLGSGNPAKRGDEVCIAYELKLPDGKVVLSDDEACFEVGSGTVITGIDRAVVGMRSGGAREAVCPPHLHWGRQGYGPIPPNTILTIDVTMKQVR